MSNDFLVEIGTEELPPKALRSLMDAFAEGLTTAVDDARLEHGAVHAYASPRRLTVLIETLADAQEDRKLVQKGPPVKVAFDDDGNARPAAVAFAKKCGVALQDLGRESTDKGEWLMHEGVEQGRSAAQLMPELVEQALAALPIPRRMRWGAGDAEFVRPVHWIVMLHGANVVAASVMGIKTGNCSQGHRFHSAGDVVIQAAGEYLQRLEEDGYVIADFERRRELVRAGVEAEAASAGGSVVDGESLFDEVTALVEWPVPITGQFDKAFLALPREVVVSTLTGHQRYFPIEDKDGELLPNFITVANIESQDPDEVRRGNERVILPRLADAAFFWDSDKRKPLGSREEALRDVVYQQGLGSVYDKSARVAALGKWIAAQLAADEDTVSRAAMLSKCDLVTGMVGEFPELQGVMGRYYALLSNEPQAVADAIGEHYAPRFAGDTLPQTDAGRILAIADKLDTLAGVFMLGKKPSGNRDPFGLRRAALGVVRIIIECGIELDLPALLAEACALQPKGKVDASEAASELLVFVSERLRRYFLDADSELQTETFDAVRRRAPASLLDFQRRLEAVQEFLNMEEAQSLAAANKRIANILKKAEVDDVGEVKEGLLQDEAEKSLFAALAAAREDTRPLLAERNYGAALQRLARLRAPVDDFFEDVMVMADDDALRRNRLALLAGLRALFLDIADVSRLSIA
ncbi:MAG: glycine--tRNA ligase subunit beta [Woeseiaceae bacterium]